MVGAAMPANFAMSLMTVSEFLLWAVVGFVFWKKSLHRRFPAMSKYLALKVGATAVLLAFFYLIGQRWAPGAIVRPAYFYFFWSAYTIGAVVQFFVCLEIFNNVLAAFSGLRRLGTVAFRWVALVSLIVCLATVPYTQVQLGGCLFSDISEAVMRSVSVLVLCVLGFLAISMNALGLSARDKAFGIALGFGLMSANDFIVSTLISRFETLTSPLQFVNESLTLLSLGIWVAYCATPEPARRPIVVPVSSTIYRWNEIAQALGHGTRIAVQQPANSFFLSDVEKVVDKVLTRTNLQTTESKS